MSGNRDKSNQADDKISSPADQILESESSNDRKLSPQMGSSPIEIKGSSSSQQRNSVPTKDPTGIITDADGNPIPLDRIIKTANTMSNMMIAHKIALEDDFRLERGMDISGPLMSLSPIIGSSPAQGTSFGGHAPEPSLESRVKDIVHDAYWDLFRTELESQSSENKEERKFDISKQLLRDVKQKVIELLLPQHERLKQDIEDRLDPNIIDQLSRVESLDLLDYAKYVLNVLSKLCAPVRDEMLKELEKTTDTVQMYRGIMELLELMRLDFANFTLDTFKPHIKAHSHEFERDKFNEILKQQETIGIDGLEYTRVWLKRAVDKVDSIHGIADLVNDVSLNLDNEELTSSSIMTESTSKADSSKRDIIIRSDIINKILNTGYCELLEWTADKQKLYPETLLFDEGTFKQLGEQYKILVLTSSILLTTFAFLNRFKLSDNTDFKVLAKSHVITLLTASYDDDPTVSNNIENSLDHVKLETIAAKLIVDIKQMLEETKEINLKTFEDQVELFKRQILDLQNSSNRVKELSRRRIMEFVETLLNIAAKHQQKKISSKLAPPVNIPLGLNCLADEITLTMAQLVKIVRYNRKVFFEHYENIIIELVSKVI